MTVKESSSPSREDARLLTSFSSSKEDLLLVMKISKNRRILFSLHR